MTDEDEAVRGPNDHGCDSTARSAHTRPSHARRSISKKELARYLKFRKDLSASPTNPRAALEGGNEEGGAAKGGPPPPAAPEIADETRTDGLYA